MKVCFLCNEYPPCTHGGIGTFVQALARALVRAGHRVHVLGMYPPGSEGTARERDEGVEVVRLFEPDHPLGWMHGRHALWRTIVEWSRAGDVDLIEVPDWQGWAAAWPALPVPVVARLHGSACYFAAEMGRRASRLTRWIERASLRRADFWCSSSRYAACRTRQLFRLPTEALAVLYNPVEIPKDAPHGHDRSRTRIVFSGTLTPKKGVVPLIAAWPAVADAVPHAELHIYGKDGRTAAGGSMRAFLQHRMNGHPSARVYFHGHVMRAELFEALRYARAAVFPSFAEAFAIAPLEAMACRCPTIASARGSGRELIEPGVHGLLVNPDRPAEIADALVRLLRDDALCDRVGEAGYAHARASFSLETLLPQNEAFYRRCVAAFAPARS